MKTSNNDLSEGVFYKFNGSHPEAKLELLDGRLIVGNCLDGSRLLLQQILRGWGAEAAVALGSIDQWVEALCQAYGFKGAENNSMESLEAQAASIVFQAPDLGRGREGENAGHAQVRSQMIYAFYRVAEELGGESLGRGFVMKLGDNGVTPDLMFFKGRKLNTLHEYFLDGPAELVIEVTRPAHQIHDREIKRELHARYGVPEYLIVDPSSRSTELYRLVNKDYRLIPPDSDGRYRPQSAPGLAIIIDELWNEDYFINSKQPFVAEKPAAKSRPRWAKDDHIYYETLPFEPRLSMLPERIEFDEYIAWSSEPKFEFLDGRPWIGGREGIRNLTGLLAMTLGLVEVCRLIPPLDWVGALKSRLAREAREQETRNHWRRKAIEVAGDLRQKFGFKRIGIAGDLVGARPLSYWSELTLVIWEMKTKDSYEIYEVVIEFEDESTPRINYVEAENDFFQNRLKVSGVEVVEI
ncbi:MAG: Uma2 family endonuclease [Blastocatellia bacterium]